MAEQAGHGGGDGPQGPGQEPRQEPRPLVGDHGEVEHAGESWENALRSSTETCNQAQAGGKASPEDSVEGTAGDGTKGQVPRDAGVPKEGCKEKAQLVLNPTFAALTYINVYTTKTRMYLVGCDQHRKRFRVLKIDRTQGNDLDLVDDGIEYAC